MPGSSVFFWTPALAVADEELVGVLGQAFAREQGDDPSEAGGDGHRVVQLEFLGVRVVGVAARQLDLGQDALLPGSARICPGGRSVAVEGDPDADLAVGDSNWLLISQSQ